MQAGLIAAILAVFLAAGLVSHDANARKDRSGGDYAGHAGGSCTGANRIRASDATCLSAGWDNSPPASSGVAGGSTYWIRNECSDYGSVVAHIDVKATDDYHWHLNNGDRQNGRYWLNDVRNIYCCYEDSALCWKNQVEADSTGHIVRMTEVSSSLVTGVSVDVSTHQARYDFCSDYPNNIYCVNDPEGDAFTEPPEPTGPACAADSSCNCGDHYCTAADCDTAWDASAPVASAANNLYSPHACSGSSHDDYASSISATDGTSETCSMTVNCLKWTARNNAGNYGAFRVLTFDREVDEFNNIYACSGVIKTPNCPTGTAISTTVRDVSF